MASSGGALPLGEKLGHVVLRALSDLKQVRAQLGAAEDTGQVVDPLEASLQLDAALHDAELALRTNAEELASVLIEEQASPPPTAGGAGGGGRRRVQVKGGGRLGTTSEYARAHAGFGFGAGRQHPQNDAVSHSLRRLLLHPEAADSRRILHDRYGVPLAPVPKGGRSAGVAVTFRPQPQGPVATAKTTKPVAVPSHELRHDPEHEPPPLDADLADLGALELAQRGLLPYGGTAIEDFLRAARVDGELFRTRRAAIHNGYMAAAAASASTRDWDEDAGGRTEKWSFPLTHVKFDTKTPALNPAEAAATAGPVAKPPPRALMSTPPVDRWAWPEKPPSLDDEQAAVAPAPAPAAPTQSAFHKLMDQHSLHEFLIRRGKVLSSTPEYESFRRAYVHIWTDFLVPLVQRLADVCFDSAVPLAVVDGKSLADLALYIRDQTAANIPREPSLDELLACVTNATQVRALVSTSEHRKELMAEQEARERAAAQIQARQRGVTTRRFYRELQLKDAAARHVQARWRLFMLRNRALQAMSAMRNARARHFVELQNNLHENWEKLASGETRRVEVHVPSFSTAASREFEAGDLHAKQNAQIGRLARCTDPNVEVIYVSPCELGDAVEGYMHKLLEFGSEDELYTTGSGAVNLPEDGAHVRYRVVVPENRHRMPAHASLSSVLLSSPRALKRIMTFIGDKPAVLVPWHADVDDIWLSTMLNIPVLGPHPLAASVLHQKSVARHLFSTAGAMTAPGVALSPLDEREWWPASDSERATDDPTPAPTDGDSAPSTSASAVRQLSDRAQLGYVLADLMVRFPHTPRWLLKLDACLSGHGLAYVDLSKLPEKAQAVILALQRAAAPQEQALRRAVDVLAPLISGSLDAATEVVSASRHGKLSGYLASLARVGGVIEAVPNDVMGSPVANVFVHPGSGRVDLLSTCEQIFCPSYSAVGYAFPQQVVPHESVVEASQAIASAAFKAGAVGHVSVEFVALTTMEGKVQLWAVDIKCHMSTAQSHFEMLHHVCRGAVSSAEGDYTVIEDNQGVESVSTRNFVTTDISFHPRLRGANLDRMFSQCRMDGVVFEPSVNAGALFLLPDTFASGCASVLAIGRDVSESLRLTVRALESLEMESRHSLASSSDGSSSEMMAPNTFAPLLATVRYLSTRVSGDTSED